MTFLVQKPCVLLNPIIGSLQTHTQLGLQDYASQPSQVDQVKPTPLPHASSHH